MPIFKQDNPSDHDNRRAAGEFVLGSSNTVLIAVRRHLTGESHARRQRDSHSPQSAADE
ncbi:hypothetical protein MHPYR_20082 [uncultured Mycobacterium sp.]|uniref:Uncharacterized protein n=1 Tax=uncultured Mycobacterium sp. TaxID=171292 RepID=A0A1Y5PF48_9MYCO|nr:hypothetical protein MHPYR_20082 [uncultured Mycobacterium sp.]